MAVEDSATVRKVLNMTLTGAGYDVIEASDGEDALHKLVGQPIDLLITDLNMPKLDGISLFSQADILPG
jgi:two-component system chemotaxis response regulator CheY